MSPNGLSLKPVGHDSLDLLLLFGEKHGGTQEHPLYLFRAIISRSWKRQTQTLVSIRKSSTHKLYQGITEGLYLNWSMLLALMSKVPSMTYYKVYGQRRILRSSNLCIYRKWKTKHKTKQTEETNGDKISLLSCQEHRSILLDILIHASVRNKPTRASMRLSISTQHGGHDIR